MRCNWARDAQRILQAYWAYDHLSRQEAANHAQQVPSRSMAGPVHLSNLVSNSLAAVKEKKRKGKKARKKEEGIGNGPSPAEAAPRLSWPHGRTGGLYSGVSNILQPF